MTDATPHGWAPGPGDALVIVDVQNDFLPGGRLGVPEGTQVVPVLNHYIERFRAAHRPVYATRDWHPEGHCSFAERGGPWPPHCIAGTNGAAFAPGLNLPEDATVISKADTPEADAYSGFQGTDLAQRLRAEGVERLFIGGLATDYCVLNTVKDALAAGFAVELLSDAIRAVNMKPDDGAHAVAEMVRAGAVPTTLEEAAP
jgi:nicotinamidase/pyrazinamidase